MVSASATRFRKKQPSATLATSNNNSSIIAKKRITRKKLALRVSHCAITDLPRENVQLFIQHGFFQAYGATVNSFLPHLVYLETTTNQRNIPEQSSIKAAVGFRSAAETLFIEQYLPKPIEQYSALSQAQSRHTIAELGNLYGTHRNYTLPLFMITGVALLLAGYSHVVFSATAQVNSILSNAGVALTVLNEAKAEMLTNNQDDWGSYYQAAPKVAVVSLAPVMALINATPRYQEMFHQQQNNICHLVQKIKELSCQ